MDEETKLDLSEKGRNKDGTPISINRRLYMQFLAFGGSDNDDSLTRDLKSVEFDSVLYSDINDPSGVGLLTLNESADFFTNELRQFLRRSSFRTLIHKSAYTMLGRTYSFGYESDLVDTLINKPREKVLDPKWPWAIWYPLRRSKSFETLSQDEQRAILGEHGKIGFKFGKSGFAKDIRLACHGLDTNDNDFVIGLLGKELYPLSAVIQAMRKTKQTSQYLESLGPFFVGKVVWQSG